MCKQQSLGLLEFCTLFDAPLESFNSACQGIIRESDFSYSSLNRTERDMLILDVLQRIESGNMEPAGPEGKDRWIQGWSENLQDYCSNNYNPKFLIPKYVHPNRPLRLFQDYIKSENGLFELDFYTVLRMWIFCNYLKNAPTIYEFACGPGYNLYMLATLFKDKELHGLDWAEPAVQLVNLIGETSGMNIKGHQFDMFHPDHSMYLASGSAVITLGGLEQLGYKFKPFINYLLDQKPSIVIHVEPALELYDENILLDYIAIRFHKKRKYLSGFFPYLRELEKLKIIKIHKLHRMFFGSLFHDGWSIAIYEPRT